MTKKTIPELSSSDIDRFLDKVNKKGPLHPELGHCWTWTSTLQHDGYGHFWLFDGVYKAHRVSWLLHKRTQPDPDLELDHLCRNRACVRPEHLEETTRMENVQRSSNWLGDGLCSRGLHEMVGANRMEDPRLPRGGQCKECKLEAQRINRFRKRYGRLPTVHEPEERVVNLEPLEI